MNLRSCAGCAEAVDITGHETMIDVRLCGEGFMRYWCEPCWPFRHLVVALDHLLDVAA